MKGYRLPRWRIVCTKRGQIITSWPTTRKEMERLVLAYRAQGFKVDVQTGTDNWANDKSQKHSNATPEAKEE